MKMFWKPIVVFIFLVGNIIGHKHSNKPLMLLLSFDGFRWDYLKMHNLPSFNYLKSIGSHADYILSSFVTSTFPSKFKVQTNISDKIIESSVLYRSLDNGDRNV